MQPLTGVVIGCGYFSQFHYDAWNRMGDVDIDACCDLDERKRRKVAQEFGIDQTYGAAEEMLSAVQPDFVDICTPPPTHRELVELATRYGAAIICQKPLAPTLDEARTLVDVAFRGGVHFMVHENFRFQPWHREMRRILDTGQVGERVLSLTFRSRLGDGWSEDAYLDRQPYFREMERLLIYETGIHFIDTFRYLAGEVQRVTAWLRRLNPVIAGEDCGTVVFEFASGAIGVYDCNRYSPSEADDPRYTFGVCELEADQGTIRLAADGTLTTQLLDGKPAMHEYDRSRNGFAGDCVFATQRHFIDCLRRGERFETSAAAYLRNIEIQEAIYESHRTKIGVSL